MWGGYVHIKCISEEEINQTANIYCTQKKKKYKNG